MRRYWVYFLYVVKHKWFVFLAGVKIGVPFWQLFVHDLSKLYCSEFVPYACHFYNQDGSCRTGGKNWLAGMKENFERAWVRHQHRNLHHWQAWLKIGDNGKVEPIPMPERYMLEMVADWVGAGRAITGKWNNYVTWFEENRNKIILHPDTRKNVETMIGRLHADIYR